MVKILCAVVLLIVCSNANANAIEVNIGDKMPGLTLPDQFDQMRDLVVSDGVVVFTAVRKGSTMVADAMPQLSNAQQQRFDYILDISEMPSWVSRWFAVPKLRKMGRTALLDRDSEQTAALPRNSEGVAAICVNQGLITEIKLVNSSEALTGLLGSDWCY